MKEITIVDTVRLVQTNCYSCQCVFMVPEWLDRQAREKGRAWFCPACGGKTIYGETEVEKLQRQLKDQAKYWENQYQFAVEREQIAENRRRATAGALTKLKKRVAVGVCPCCQRSFENLARHMKTKHPDYQAETTP